MKLKKSFLAKKIAFGTACGVFISLTGCTSTATLIPGSKQIEINNIYVEYLNIADIYYAEEKWDKAITYYNYALGNKDIYWEVYYKLAKTYAIQKNWAEAEARFKVLYKRDPKNASLKSSLAYISAMNGDTKQAKKMYLELIDEQEYNQEYYENYLSILIMEKDYDACLEEYEKIAELFPNSTNLEKFQKAVDELKPVEENSEEGNEAAEEENSEATEDEKSEEGDESEKESSEASEKTEDSELNDLEYK